MDGTRPKRESSLPRYLTSGGNPSNLKTATAIFKGKGYLGVPCSFCVGAAVLCVKNTPDTRCAFCAAWGRSFKTCQDGSSSKSTKRSAEDQPSSSQRKRSKPSENDICIVEIVQPKSSPREGNEVLMSAIPAASSSDSPIAVRPFAPPVHIIPNRGARAPSAALKEKSGLHAASSSVVSVPVAAPVPLVASVPVVASAPASAASVSIASGPPNAAVPDSVVSGSMATSAPSSAPVPSVAQAALALATAIRDAGPSNPKENLDSDIVTAFLRASPKPFSTNTPSKNSTEPMTHAVDIDARLKNLETRIDLAIANSDESVLKVNNEQKRLANLVTDNKRRMNARLADMRGTIVNYMRRRMR